MFSSDKLNSEISEEQEYNNVEIATIAAKIALFDCFNLLNTDEFKIIPIAVPESAIHFLSGEITIIII